MVLNAIGLMQVDSSKEDSLKNAVIQILSAEWPLTVKEIFKKTKQDFGKNVSYQAVHKAVQELVSKKVLASKGKKYLINSNWLQEIEAFAGITLENYSEKEPVKLLKAGSQQCRLRVYDNPDMFYRLMVPLLKKEKEFRFSSKSPSLIVSREENQTPARKKYVEELRKAIEERKVKAKYLISSDATKELIVENRDKLAIENLKKFSNNKNTKIKCAKTKAIMSYAVTKRDLFINPTAITHFAPVAVIHFKGRDMSPIQRIFDIIFAEANETDGLVKDIEKELSKKPKKVTFMRIFLCRHGETVFNAERRWQGQTDSPLTKKGLEQAKQAAECLKGKKICAIFASPLGRARKSAGFLRKQFPKAPYFELEELKEINCGEAEGLTFEETLKKWPHLIKRIKLEDLNSAFPKGETYNQVKERLRPFANKLKKEYGNKTVAMVAHGGTNKMLLGILFNLPDEELIKVSTPNDVIYEIVLTKDGCKVFNIRNGKRKKGFVLRKKESG